MNLQKGLLRVWFVLTVMWLLFCAFSFVAESHHDDLWVLATIAIGGPLALLLAGFTVKWIFLGFKPKNGVTESLSVKR